MSMVESRQGSTEGEALIAAARAGSEVAFSALTERYRRELGVHCYRLLGSFDDAQDLVQDTFLKAWRGRASFEGRSSLRAWLYRIATNGCLDFLAARSHRTATPEAIVATEPSPPPHIAWLQPFPDRLLEPAAPPRDEPDAAFVAKETIELAFLVAIQFLPAKQRAALILCDVLEWSAEETASLLGGSVASVNAALQRARATLREHQASGRLDRSRDRGTVDEEQRALLGRYVEAHERADLDALARLLRDDVRFSMPPQPETYAGKDAVVALWAEAGFATPAFGELRCVVTRANRMPAVAIYARAPGQETHRPLALDVLAIEGGLVAEVTTFCLASVLEPFDLPREL